MPQSPEVSQLSKMFFNRAHRLSVWGYIGQFAIEPPQVFAFTDVADELYRDRISHSVVHREIVDLATLGMIERTEVPHGGHAKYYARVEHPGWELVSYLIDRAQSGGEA